VAEDHSPISRVSAHGKEVSKANFCRQVQFIKLNQLNVVHSKHGSQTSQGQIAHMNENHLVQIAQQSQASQ
jgi:hypothetical protein